MPTDFVEELWAETFHKDDLFLILLFCVKFSIQ